MTWSGVAHVWGEWIWASSWQVALLAILIGATAICSRRMSARFRYALWCLLIVKIFIPPSLDLNWGIGRWAVAPIVHWGQVRMPEWIEIKEPRVDGLASADEPRLFDIVRISVPRVAATNGNKQEPVLRPASAAAGKSLPALLRSNDLFFAIWICGVFGYLILFYTRYLRTMHTLRDGQAIEEGPLRVALERLVLELEIRNAPELLLCERVSSPFLCGVFHPRIVLPKSLPETLKGNELDNVLLHELIHHKRLDVLVGWLQALVQALFWFHPLVWFANAQLRHERECACDESVLASGKSESRGYGESLLQVLLLAQGRSSAQLGSIGIFEYHSHLHQRIEGIMGQKPKARYFGVGNWLLLGLLAALFLPMSISGGARASAKTASRYAAQAGLTSEQAAYERWALKNFAGQLDEGKFKNLSQANVSTLNNEWLAALGGADTSRHPEAITGLLTIRGKQATAAFLAVVGQRDNPYRWMAIRALGLLPERAAIPELIPLAFHSNMNTRMWSQISLFRLTGQNFGNNVDQWSNWYAQESTKTSDQTGNSVVVYNGALDDPATGLQPPKIVSSRPAIGEIDVNPALDRILVTFDQDMSEGRSWAGNPDDMPPPAPDKGITQWLDKRTCMLPVKLQEGKYYRLGLNSDTGKGFCSANGIPLVPASIYFVTRGASDEMKAFVQKPFVVKMEPPNGATDVDPNLKEIRATFSVPMAPGFAWCEGGGNFPAISDKGGMRFTSDRMTCILPVILEPGKTYAFSLNNKQYMAFRNLYEIYLEPVKFTFTTRK